MVVSLNNQTVCAGGDSARPKEIQMEVTIKTGTILMKEQTLLLVDHYCIVIDEARQSVFY